MINKIFYKSYNTNTYFTTINGAFDIRNKINNVIEKIYADLYLVLIYDITNILILIILFSMYYNTLYRVPKLFELEMEELKDKLFRFWSLINTLINSIILLFFIYNNLLIFFKKKKIFYKFKIIIKVKKYKITYLKKIIFNINNLFFNTLGFFIFFKFSNNFFIFNLISSKNSIYYEKNNYFL